MTVWIWLAPFLAQGAVMSLDELVFHRQRGLPLWERIGHPIDTISFLSCLIFALIAPPDPTHFKIYAGLGLLSCLLITKDEFVHTGLCSKMENWLHALLFVLHPILLFEVGFLWVGVGAGAGTGLGAGAWTTPVLGRALILGESALASLFLVYQILHWWLPSRERQ